MHHRKYTWGDDADEFKPERRDYSCPGLEYNSFSGGPRVCIGRHETIMKASYLTLDSEISSELPGS